MLGNIIFIIIISGCIIAIIVLLIIQYLEKKKKKELAELAGEVYEESNEPIENVGVPNVLYTYLPSGMTYKKTLRSFHMSMHKIKTKYKLSKEDISALPKSEQEELFSLCKKNIIAFKRVRELENDDKLTTVEGVPAYEYLSYIYEIRGDYQYAMYTCATAIKLNACTPDGKREMIDRIHVLSDEGDLEIPDNIKELIE